MMRGISFRNPSYLRSRISQVETVFLLETLHDQWGLREDDIHPGVIKAERDGSLPAG